ncbi:MAG TPA: hypothetical protein PK280_03910 [Planctomycetota bacterium]|nr:hypothetical protein [Planctomycetota bacterium]
MRVALMSALALGLMAAAAMAAEPALPSFTKKPSAAKAGDKFTVSFAVDRETDVAVYVEDAAGKVVCHLAAGVLGAKAPAPLKPGLAQSLEWDGRDDRGQPAQGGPFKVRVALGLSPKFESFLLNNPDVVTGLETFAGGPDGSVYVFYRDGAANFNQGGIKVKVLDREGRFRRMLLPFPADVPGEKTRAMGAMQDEAGRLVPRIHSWQSLNFYPDPQGSGRGRSLSSNPAVDSKGGVHWMLSGGLLASLSADGGSPYPEFLSRALFEKGVAGWYLAVGEGDRYLYVSGASRVKGKESEPLPCVYRVDLATRAEAAPFLGKPTAEAGQEPPVAAPGHIACAGGLLYVVDPRAGRVAAFREKDGSPAGELKVDSARYVGADPESGAVYVVCATKDELQYELVKFEGLKTGREVCRAKMPRESHRQWARPLLAVDASRQPVRIWAQSLYTSQGMYFFEDVDGKLVLRDELRKRYSPLMAAGPKDLRMDRARGELHLQTGGQPVRIDEASGKLTVVSANPNWSTRVTGWGNCEVVPCEDGNLVTMGYPNGMMRWTREAKPLPWDGAPDNGPKNTGLTHAVMTLGPDNRLAVRKDEIYVVDPGEGLTCLNVHGLDGKAKRTALWQCTGRAIPRVDARGNIYVAEPVKPKGRMCPEFFDGKRTIQNPKEVDPYNYIYGSIIKFPPEGGAIWYEKKLPKAAKGEPPEALAKKPGEEFSYPGTYCRGLKNGTVQGAEWVRFGFSPYSQTWGIGSEGCHCENAGFDVDDFGRVFYPNLGQFRVEMVDTANNPIGAFGHYGNLDSGGPDARLKAPEIPLAWPVYVAVSDRYAYVADTINLRVVKVRLSYATEENCTVQ